MDTICQVTIDYGHFKVQGTFKGLAKCDDFVKMAINHYGDENANVVVEMVSTSTVQSYSL